jgi:DNA-binding MarR family transcriptional regulator
MTARRPRTASGRQHKSSSAIGGAALEFMRAVWALDHALRSRSKLMKREVGVTGPQRLVLRIVGTTPGISAGALAEALHVHPSTLTGVLERMSKRRLLTRKQDPADARRAVLYLTERGEAFDKVRAGTVEAAVLRVLSSVDEQEVATAQNVLAALVRELEKQ